MVYGDVGAVWLVEMVVKMGAKATDRLGENLGGLYCTQYMISFISAFEYLANRSIVLGEFFPASDFVCKLGNGTRKAVSS